jgi:hypothetical protein
MAIMDMIERAKAQAMARELAKARAKSLVVRIPENVANDSAAAAIDLSLKVWDVLTGLLEIASTVKLVAGASAAAKISLEAIAANEAAAMAAASAGSGKVTMALTVGEAMTLAGPLVAYIGLWVGLGSPYLEARQKIADDRARRGVAHGVLIGAFGHRPERARGFLLRQNEGPNHWDQGAAAVAQNSYRMAFIAGYKQGRDMSQNQRKVFWKAFANTLRKERAPLWDNDWQGDALWDKWFLEAGIVFQKRHITA